MPTLILSPSYNTDSRILRKAALAFGWDTFRFEGDSLPAGYTPAAAPCAIFCTVPKAFKVARQLDSMLLGASSGWLAALPCEYSKRRVELLELRRAADIAVACFLKPALGKSFDAAVRTGPQLAAQTTHLPSSLLVHAAEVVEWEIEYRCFVKDQEVLAGRPYRRGEVTFSSYTSPLRGPRQEAVEASQFAHSVVRSVSCPRAFVLDVGIIRGRGWAVVEPNECWGAGIYGCTPAEVLQVLLAALVPKRKMTSEDQKWDYAEHYFRACPHMQRA